MELRRSETNKLLSLRVTLSLKKKKKKRKRTNKTILGGFVYPENGRANKDEPKEDKRAVRMQLARILCII